MAPGDFSKEFKLSNLRSRVDILPFQVVRLDSTTYMFYIYISPGPYDVYGIE